MLININEQSERNFVTFSVSGILFQAYYKRFVPQVKKFHQQRGKLRELFGMTSFQDWEAAGIWEELQF